MDTITIKIETGNDAFQGDNYRFEVARILERIAVVFKTYGRETGTRKIKDSNGNTVCTIETD